MTEPGRHRPASEPPMTHEERVNDALQAVNAAHEPTLQRLADSPVSQITSSEDLCRCGFPRREHVLGYSRAHCEFCAQQVRPNAACTCPAGSPPDALREALRDAMEVLAIHAHLDRSNSLPDDREPPGPYEHEGKAWWQLPDDGKRYFRHLIERVHPEWVAALAVPPTEAGPRREAPIGEEAIAAARKVVVEAYREAIDALDRLDAMDHPQTSVDLFSDDLDVYAMELTSTRGMEFGTCAEWCPMCRKAAEDARAALSGLPARPAPPEEEQVRRLHADVAKWRDLTSDPALHDLLGRVEGALAALQPAPTERSER